MVMGAKAVPVINNKIVFSRVRLDINEYLTSNTTQQVPGSSGSSLQDSPSKNIFSFIPVPVFSRWCSCWPTIPDTYSHRGIGWQITVDLTAIFSPPVFVLCADTYSGDVI